MTVGRFRVPSVKIGYSANQAVMAAECWRALLVRITLIPLHDGQPVSRAHTMVAYVTRLPAACASYRQGRDVDGKSLAGNLDLLEIWKHRTRKI